MYSTGDVAKLFGVTVKAVHYWEYTGQLKPTTRVGGRHIRLYSEEDVLAFKEKWEGKSR